MFSMTWRVVLLGVLGLPLMAQAVEVGPCGDLDRITYLAGTPRSFGNGSIRVAAVDTEGEPVCCSYHLLVFIPAQEMGTQCFAVSQQAAREGETVARGFMGVDVAAIQASYDPRRGLLLQVPYQLYDENGSGAGIPGETAVRVNLQGEGSVRVEE